MVVITSEKVKYHMNTMGFDEIVKGQLKPVILTESDGNLVLLEICHSLPNPQLSVFIKLVQIRNGYTLCIVSGN